MATREITRQMQPVTGVQANTVGTGAIDTGSGVSARTQEVVYCGMFAALMAAGAMIKVVLPIGIYEVTVSLQLFAAVLAGFLLGPGRGLRAVSVYLLIGLLGVPVYAHGGGPGYLLKPTYGFLLGFAAAALVVGLVYRVLGSRATLRNVVIAGVAGEMVYYACGLLYYYIMLNQLLPGRQIGIYELLAAWFLPTVIPDLVIAVVASLLAQQLIPRIGYYTER